MHKFRYIARDGFREERRTRTKRSWRQTSCGSPASDGRWKLTRRLVAEVPGFHSCCTRLEHRGFLVSVKASNATQPLDVNRVLDLGFGFSRPSVLANVTERQGHDPHNPSALPF